MPISFLRGTTQAADDLSDEDRLLLDQMIDSLVEDIDTCWNSSIACCDDCYDEYRAKWPLAYTSGSGIQYQSVPADVFYAGSKHFCETVTEEEFERLLSYVGCPNCSHQLGPNLFAFELPFDADEYAGDLERVRDLALRAPFLVATDPFAEKSRTEIARLCASATSSPLDRLQLVTAGEAIRTI